jgi:hypothetical protein
MAAKLDAIWAQIWRDSHRLEWTKDAASATIFVICALCTRGLLSFLRVLPYIPEGLVFGIPLLFHYFTRVANMDFLRMQHYPNISVRITEVFLGRIDKSRLPSILSSQLVGTLFGTGLFYTLTSWMCSQPHNLLLPIRSSIFGDNEIYAAIATNSDSSMHCSDSMADSGNCTQDISNHESSIIGLQYYNNIEYIGTGFLLQHILVDTILSCIYSLCIVILPELMHVNKIPLYWSCGPLAVIFLLHSLLLSKDSLSASTNPIIASIFWYLHHSDLPETASVNAAVTASAAPMPSLDVLLAAVGVDVTALPSIVTVIINCWPIQSLFVMIQCIHYYTMQSTLFTEHFLGSILGGIVSGIICSKVTPDDKDHWKRQV